MQDKIDRIRNKLDEGDVNYALKEAKDSVKHAYKYCDLMKEFIHELSGHGEKMEGHKEEDYEFSDELLRQLGHTVGEAADAARALGLDDEAGELSEAAAEIFDLIESEEKPGHGKGYSDKKMGYGRRY